MISNIGNAGGILDVENSSEYIKNMLASDQPFMIARLGSEESRTLSRYRMHLPYTKRNIHNIMYNAGVFPNDKKTVDEFCMAYSEAISEADAFFVWGCFGETANIRRYNKKENKLLEYKAAKFMLYDNPWTIALEGKRVLVVHPFVQTIEKQYQRRSLIFPDKSILPDFKALETVKCVQSNSGEHIYLPFKSYFEVLNKLINEIDSKEYDVALVGAGAYGLPLCQHVRQQGKQAIYMAGLLQLLFGIKGKRWDENPAWSKYYNEYWVYPSESETPRSPHLVEGGSYWK